MSLDFTFVYLSSCVETYVCRCLVHGKRTSRDHCRVGRVVVRGGGEWVGAGVSVALTLRMPRVLMQLTRFYFIVPQLSGK